MSPQGAGKTQTLTVTTVSAPVETTLHGLSTLVAPNGGAVTVFGSYSANPIFLVTPPRSAPTGLPVRVAPLVIAVGAAGLVLAVLGWGQLRRRRHPTPAAIAHAGEVRWASLLAVAAAPALPSRGHPIPSLGGLAPPRLPTAGPPAQPVLPGLEPAPSPTPSEATSVVGEPAAARAQVGEVAGPNGIVTDGLVRVRLEMWAPPASATSSGAGGPAVLVMGPVEPAGWAASTNRAIVVELAAFLALHADRARSSGEIRAEMWPLGEDGSRQEVSDHTLRSYVTYLRQALGAEHLPAATGGAGYRLTGVRTDWARFCELTELPSPDRTAALVEALGLVRGAPFAGAAPFTYGWAWGADPLASRIEAAVVGAAVELGERALSVGEWGQAAWAARQGLLCAPADASLHGLVLRAAGGAGDRAEMDRAWRDAAAALGDEEREVTLGGLYRQLRTPTPD